MRPDVARAFDRMAAAARRDGIYLIVTSGYRSDSEQARLFAAQPAPQLFRLLRTSLAAWRILPKGYRSQVWRLFLKGRGPAVALSARLACDGDSFVATGVVCTFVAGVTGTLEEQSRATAASTLVLVVRSGRLGHCAIRSRSREEQSGSSGALAIRRRRLPAW
jgi:hypothetical protein